MVVWKNIALIWFSMLSGSLVSKKSDGCRNEKTADSQWRWQGETSGLKLDKNVNFSWKSFSYLSISIQYISLYSEMLSMGILWKNVLWSLPIYADQSNPKTNCRGSKEVLSLEVSSWLSNQMISLILIFGFLRRSNIFLYPDDLRNIVQQCARRFPDQPEIFLN